MQDDQPEGAPCFAENRTDRSQRSPPDDGRGVQAADSARYPSWKGAWERYVPPVSVVSPSGLRTPGGQPSFDQTKPWGPGQEAPLTPEYQKVLEESIADQAERRPGQ